MTTTSRAPRGPGAAPARTRGPVLVVGTGLLGTSVALGLRAEGVEVQLQDASPAAAALAADLGAGAARAPGDPAPALVVVAAPPDVCADVVAAQLRAHPGAVVTDVASVKSAVAARLAELLAEDPAGEGELARYVGSHPMAGRERSGPVAGRADLFAARPWVLCPTPATSPRAVEAVRALADDLGATAVVMDAARHDEAVALVSHVPQLAASLVAGRLRAAPDEAVALAGQGVRDVTRIAASDPGLWTAILAANAGPVAAVLRAVRDDLDDVLGALERLAGAGERADRRGSDGGVPGAAPGALGALARAIAEGGEGRARIPGKHGTAPTAYAVITVLVPDEPGQLARLFADVAAAGVNLEELVLEHAPGRLVGLAEVSVLPAARAGLESSLRGRGWVVAG